MPRSCIVMPYMTSASSIVLLLCVIIINCDILRKSLSTFENLVTLDSSRGASISSRTQKGLGFTLNIAKRSAVAVIAFSPPDNNVRF